SKWFCNPLDVEALAAPAFILHLGVAELEALVQSLARVVELGAVDVRQALRVDQHLDAVALELHVVRVGLVDELELVGHSGAARGTHPHAQAHPLAALGEEVLDVVCRFFGERHCHQATFFSSTERFFLYSATAALMAHSARIEPWIFTGGSERSSAIWVFLMVAASSRVLPLTHSVTSELEAMAEPQP